jgi:hypothetical protein
MTLAETGEIFAYWAEHPPAHLMVQAIARMLGWKPRPVAVTASDIVASAPPGLAVVRGAELGMPAPVFEVEAMRAKNHARLSNSHGGL